MKVRLLRKFRQERIWNWIQSDLRTCFVFHFLEPRAKTNSLIMRLKIIWEEILIRLKIISVQPKRFHYLLTSDWNLYVNLGAFYPDEYVIYQIWIELNRKKYEKYSRKYWTSGAKLRRAIENGTIE